MNYLRWKANHFSFLIWWCAIFLFPFEWLSFFCWRCPSYKQFLSCFIPFIELLGNLLFAVMIFVIWNFLNHITKFITTLCPVKTIYLKARILPFWKITHLYHSTTISNVWRIDDFPIDLKSKHIFWSSQVCLKTSKRCSLDIAKIQLPTWTGIESVKPFFANVYSKLMHESSSQNKGVIALRYLEFKAWLS